VCDIQGLEGYRALIDEDKTDQTGDAFPVQVVDFLACGVPTILSGIEWWAISSSHSLYSYIILSQDRD
jgi:hypothetical protein